MHMDEMEAAPSGDDKQNLLLLNLTVNMTKEVAMPAAFFFLRVKLKLFWQQLQKLKSCNCGTPIVGDDSTRKHREDNFLVK